MSRIGFVLLTHSKPHQIERLVTRLNSMFDSPPIVIHHDFSKCPLPEDFLPAMLPNVSFVRPHVVTGWGKFSIVEATLLGMAQLYRLPDAPDWCAILSGACYPIKPAAQMLAELTTSGYDAYIQHSLVNLESLSKPTAAPPDPLDNLTLEWHRDRYDRYCKKRIVVPFVDKRLRPKMRIVRLPQIIGRYFIPFSDKFSCYSGGHWFTTNRRAAEYIFDFQKTPLNTRLVSHYQDIKWNKKNLAPEESYFQTVLCNAPDLSISYYNLRYIDWSEHWETPGGTGHPKALTLADLPKIQASATHFARKIDLDSDADLLDALDRIIDGGEPLTVPVEAAGKAR